MATIEFRANEGISAPINTSSQGISGSGLGFFGSAGALSSVRLSEYQDRTFVCNAGGTATSVEIDNVKYTHSASGAPSRGGVSSTGNMPLQKIPNYQSTLNVRFTHDSPVKTQNAKLQIYDRVSTSNGPSGVYCQVASIIHPETSTGVVGSGSSAWVQASGSATTLSCHTSPGESGISISGSSTQEIQHDWYVAISASPISIGSKTEFGLYFSVEYL